MNINKHNLVKDPHLIELNKNVLYIKSGIDYIIKLIQNNLNKSNCNVKLADDNKSYKQNETINKKLHETSFLSNKSESYIQNDKELNIMNNENNYNNTNISIIKKQNIDDSNENNKDKENKSNTQFSNTLNYKSNETVNNKRSIIDNNLRLTTPGISNKLKTIIIERSKSKIKDINNNNNENNQKTSKNKKGPGYKLKNIIDDNNNIFKSNKKIIELQDNNFKQLETNFNKCFEEFDLINNRLTNFEFLISSESLNKSISRSIEYYFKDFQDNIKLLYNNKSISGTKKRLNDKNLNKVFLSRNKSYTPISKSKDANTVVYNDINSNNKDTNIDYIYDNCVFNTDNQYNQRSLYSKSLRNVCGLKDTNSIKVNNSTELANNLNSNISKSQLENIYNINNKSNKIISNYNKVKDLKLSNLAKTEGKTDRNNDNCINKKNENIYIKKALNTNNVLDHSANVNRSAR